MKQVEEIAYTEFHVDTTLIPIHHLCMKATKLIHAFLDRTPPMLERTGVAIGHNRVGLHIFLLMMEVGMYLLPQPCALLLGSTYSIHACG